jgi:hypothetical protein
MRLMTATVVVDLEAAGIDDADAEAAVRQLLSAPLELRNGDLMYYWKDSVEFNVEGAG